MRAAAALLLAACAALAAAGVGAAALAQEAPLDLRVDLEPRRATLGDRVRLTIAVEHADDLLVTAEPPASRPALAIVEAAPPATADLGAGRLRTEFAFTFAAFELGVARPDPVVVRWLRADGRSGAAEASPPPFEVVSAAVGDPSALRPLKPQAAWGEPPAPWLRPALVGGGALAAAAIALLAVRRLRRRAPAPAPAPAAPGLEPEIEARRRLEEIAASGAIGAREYEAFYGAIALVMRRYLEARFAFPATALTTPELDGRMAGAGVERWQSRLAEGLLDRCDAAVYAGAAPDPASADHDLTVAFEIVELSRERIAAGAANGGAADDGAANGAVEDGA